MSAEFDFKAAYRKAHDDLCAVEGRNYVLERRIETLEAENGALMDLRDAREIFIASLASRTRALEAALRDVLNITDEYVVPCSLDIGDRLRAARKALGEGGGGGKTLMEEVAELRAVFNGTLGEE